MRLSPICRRTYYRSLLVMAGLAGIVFAGLLGCDNLEVQTVILGGLQDLANTMVDAFFITLQPEEEMTPVTVSWIMDTVHSLSC